MFAGGNEKDVHLKNVAAPRDYQVIEYGDFRQAQANDPCARCGKPLKIRKGIEVGHIFKLGTKYSEALQATFLDQAGKEKPIIMGCYGIGVGRTVAAAIEQHHDKDGIIIPFPLAPYQVLILPVNINDAKIRATAFKIYNELNKSGIEVLLDDRDERPGIKFKDADLIGIPLRVTIGQRTLEEGKVELRFRHSQKVELLGIENITGYLNNHLSQVFLR